MTCREFADFMVDYLGDGLTAETRAEFERHLRLCVNCRRYLDGYTATIKLGKRAFDDLDAHVPTDAPEELVQAILAARTSKTDH